MSGPQWQTCPTPEKVKFLDKAGAQGHIDRKWRGLPARAYRCTCGFWHVTSPKGRKGKG